MTVNTSRSHLVAMLFLTTLLTACGEGGSDNTSASPITSPPVISTPDDQPEEPTDIPVGTGSEPTENDPQGALSASNHFSLARTSCGLGGLSLDTELDDIAIQHANYIKYAFANGSPSLARYNAHVEDTISGAAEVTGTNNPFFSGLSFSNRLINANYSNARYGVTENIAQSTYFSSAGNFLSNDVVASLMARSLLAAPYHLRSLMLPASSLVGTGMVSYKPNGENPATSQGYVLVSHASATQTTRDNTVSGIFTYPCQGVTGTVTALYNESPNPVRNTGRDLSTDPIGQPVYISMPTANRIKISNIKFRDLQRAQDVPIQLLDFDNDPYLNTEYALPANEAFILPITDDLDSCESERSINQSQQCGLYGNTQYQVSFDVLVDNRALEKQSFTFTTGEVNY
ncbi:CAP domain-containing protein [Psychrobacter vallis]|uniref:CAP domain-containing protein n=1 Tax=Psychrobacter vallis TaxID=248451 RepID=UPI00191A5791|nr:CAP domain-containing protein [Psychrobacter vallis]